MKVQIVDPPAYTPPYDRSLAAALARAGAEVELVTSAFSHGSVPPTVGYEVREEFYRRSALLRPGSPLRRLRRGLEHVPDMLRYRSRVAPSAELVHLQWLGAPGLDAALLPRDRPLVLTPHGLLRQAASPRALARLAARMDALVALSEYGAGVLRDRGVDPDRIHVIPHGPLDYLTRFPDEKPLNPELAAVEGPVVLYFGLIRPYKGVDVLLDAFREVEGAELWIVGRPFGVDEGELEAAARRCASPVRLIPRFVDDAEVPALFRRADLVVLPHVDAEQSGVLYSALAFAKATVLTDVGGFAEVAETGAGRLVPPRDPVALGAAISELLADPGARRRLEEAAFAAASGPYSWDAIADAHLALYRSLGVG
jgi:glycosyltransferase involved in cell wall biosynthesis